jgi:hypothetical protein
MTDDRELDSRLTRYLQWYSTYPRPASAERAGHRSLRAAAPALVAIVAAGALAGGFVLLRGHSPYLGASPSAPQILLQPGGCVSSPPANDLSDLCSTLEAVPLTGGSTQQLPAEAPNGAVAAVDIGHLVQVAMVGPRAVGWLQDQQITGLDVQDLTTGQWHHVTLSATVTRSAVQHQTTPPPGPHLSTSYVWDTEHVTLLNPDEDGVAVYSGGGATVTVIDVDTGWVRTLSPGLGNLSLIGWFGDGIHVLATCPGESADDQGSCAYVIDPASGQAHRQPAEDEAISVTGSPDGTLELANEGEDVLTGPAGGTLATIYSVPGGDAAFGLALSDGGRALVWEEDRDSLLVVANGVASSVAAPAGGWGCGTGASALPAGGAGAAAYALPNGGFVVQLGCTGAGGSDSLLTVQPDGSSTEIPLPEDDTFAGVAW